jgi:hypothetical protein
MKILFFGYGAVALKRYMPALTQVIEEGIPADDLLVQCVDPLVPGCLTPDRWPEEPADRLREIDRVLVLSPPSQHWENLAAVSKTYSAHGLALPDVYVEKPLYLRSKRPMWERLLADYPRLETKAHYIDHYRFKDALTWLIEHLSDVTSSLGAINELGFISLERQAFWDSTAFGQGYFLEHACHLVSMLDRAFPWLTSREWAPLRLAEWRVWEQIGRPDSCKRDSASLSFMALSGEQTEAFPGDLTLTTLIGKGLVDIKALFLGGRNGYCQLWFNEGRLVLRIRGQAPAVMFVPKDNTRQRVAEAIVSGQCQPGLLLSIRQGLAEQERVIGMERHFPSKGSVYAVNEVPDEFAAELVRMGFCPARPSGESSGTVLDSEAVRGHQANTY